MTQPDDARPAEPMTADALVVELERFCDSQKRHGSLYPRPGLIEKCLAELAAARAEVDGLTKANALLNAGMGSVCEGRDDLKHENRKLLARAETAEGRVAQLEREVQSLSLTVADAMTRLREVRRERDAMRAAAQAVCEPDPEAFSSSSSAGSAHRGVRVERLEALAALLSASAPPAANPAGQPDGTYTMADLMAAQGVYPKPGVPDASLAAAKPGKEGARTEQCPTCEGEGGWMDNGEPSTCDDCGGSGLVTEAGREG